MADSSASQPFSLSRKAGLRPRWPSYARYRAGGLAQSCDPRDRVGRLHLGYVANTMRRQTVDGMRKTHRRLPRSGSVIARHPKIAVPSMVVVFLAGATGRPAAGLPACERVVGL